MSSCEKVVSIETCKRRSNHSLPPVYAPSLVITHGKKYHDQTFCILADNSYHTKSVLEMRGMICYASCYGWLILQNRDSSECCLFEPVTLTKIHLPPLTNATSNIAVLTAPPNDPNCIVMFYNGKRNSCSFCRIGNRSWIEQEVDRKKKNDSDFVPYDSAISSKGKIYLFSWKGAVVIEVRDTFAIIAPCEIQECHSSLPHATAHSHYYLEACGDIYRIRVIYLGITRIAQSIIVNKLDFSTMAWVKVENLCDMIFLLGDYSISVLAADFGAKGNCVYFCAHHRTNLCCFDMEDGTITVTQPCPTKFPQWGGIFWMVPNCKLQLKKNLVKAEGNVEAKVKEEQGTWEDLPVELLQLILQSLFSSDCIRFRLTCKAWLSIRPLVRPLPHLEARLDSQHAPWLISFSNNTKGGCHFSHPIYNDAYTLNLPQLAHTTVRYAKFGWLLVSGEGESIFFYNPTTTETIKLPEVAYYGFANIAFSSPPTSPDCVVFGHIVTADGWIHMMAYRKEEDDWSTYCLAVPYTFIASNSNPVFRDGVFYSLSQDGKLGVFNPKESKKEDRWKVYTDLSVPHVAASSSGFLIAQRNSRSFIVECDGDILSVFVSYMGSPVFVYKLDQSNNNMKWNKVESLGDKVMFLSHGTSLLIQAGLKGIENRIYFPRFKENASVFYSLKSGNYHSFGEEESPTEWIGTSEHWNCTWFQSSD
ncbi:hypothetical protein ACHQM5_011627 [Ranunculus cassubicifolius]